jgi:replication factor C subunit 3/5
MQESNTNENIPWVEKYRPEGFDDVILDAKTKRILQNILDSQYFPNLLFFGPPGVGKTTTIMTMIKKWNHLTGTQFNNCIHLNASDERGIDVIRSQIMQFVSCKSLFEHSLKFIILDEVDYMTRPAQEALYQLIQSHQQLSSVKSSSSSTACALSSSSSMVRFCLICNYLNRLDSNISSEMINIHFNNLPRSKLFTFLQDIATKEGLGLPMGFLNMLVDTYKTDVRSMINCMQTNQQYLVTENTPPSSPVFFNIMSDDDYKMMLSSLFSQSNGGEDNNVVIQFELQCARQY